MPHSYEPLLSDLIARSNELGIQFLRTELSIAGTLLDRSETTRDANSATNARDEALKAMAMADRLLRKLSVPETDLLRLHSQLELLRDRVASTAR
jgi:hypothetical protein